MSWQPLSWAISFCSLRTSYLDREESTVLLTLSTSILALVSTIVGCRPESGEDGEDEDEDEDNDEERKTLPLPTFG